MKPQWWIGSALQDDRLPVECRTLLVWLGMRPAGWRYNVAEAERAMCVERKKYQRMLAALKEAGWVETAYKRDKRGRIKHVRLIVRDTVSPEGAKSTLRIRATRRCRMKPSGPEGANSTQTSKKNHAPENGEIASFLRVIGGRNA